MLSDQTGTQLLDALLLADYRKALISHNEPLPEESAMKTLYDYVVIEKVGHTEQQATDPDPKVIKADQVWAYTSEDAKRRIFCDNKFEMPFDALEVLVRPFCS